VRRQLVRLQTQSKISQPRLREYAMDQESCRPEAIRYHQMFRRNNLASMARPHSSTHLHPTTSRRSHLSNTKNITMRCNTHSLSSSRSYRQCLVGKSCLKALHQ